MEVCLGTAAGGAELLARLQTKPFAHVIRGAYGAGQAGGAEITASAAAVNSHVLQWYITGMKPTR